MIIACNVHIIQFSLLANAPQQFMANVAQCAMNNETFCTKNDGYPMDHIKNLLREHANKYADAFVTDVSTNDITDRVVDRIEGLDDEYMCESYEKVIFPTTGKTQDGRDQFIINTDEFKQGVRVSMCRRAGQPCKLSEHFPNDFKSECKQQMVYRQLLSLSSSGQPIKSHFEFPACCSCVLHRA